jgi:hypothetical protein
MENSFYGLLKTMIYYGSIWLRIGMAEQILVEVSHIEFQQCLLNGLWDTWKGQLIATCKPGFIFGTVWLKTRTAPLLMVQVSHVELLKYTWKVSGIHEISIYDLT